MISFQAQMILVHKHDRGCLSLTSHCHQTFNYWSNLRRLGWNERDISPLVYNEFKIVIVVLSVIRGNMTLFTISCCQVIRYNLHAWMILWCSKRVLISRLFSLSIIQITELKHIRQWWNNNVTKQNFLSPLLLQTFYEYSRFLCLINKSYVQIEDMVLIHTFCKIVELHIPTDHGLWRIHKCGIV